jgi:hypothetical protein
MDGFDLTIEKLCSEAWANLAPNEPICKTHVARNPYRYRFNTQWLPGLFLWVDRSQPVTVERLSAGLAVRSYELSLLWMPSPAAWEKSEKWTEFWVALDGVAELAINTEFSPWTTSTAWGQSLVDAADLMKLTLGSGSQEPIKLDGIDSPFEGYLWKLQAQLLVSFDPTFKSTALPAPVSPNKLAADFEGGDDGSFVLASRLPKDAEQWT